MQKNEEFYKISEIKKMLKSEINKFMKLQNYYFFESRN